MNKTPRRVGLKGLALLAALSAATWLPTPAQAGKADDTLNIAWDRELPNVDYYYNTSREGIVVNRLVWDTLIYRDPTTGEFSGLLAESFEIVDDTTFEFKLRKGVKFHNGDGFSAKDVVATINFLLAPDTGKLSKQTVDWIKGAEALDDYTVRIYAKAPTPLATLYLAGDIPMYPADHYAKVGPGGMGKEPVGTGPYKITKMVPGKEIVFEANADYFAGSPKGKPAISKILQRTIPDVNTQIVELTSGKLDWIWKVPADQAEKLATLPSLNVVSAGTMRVGYLQFDAAGRSGKNPFQDVRVRKAVSYAIDRKAIVDNIVRGASEVINSACYPEQFGCTQDVTTYEYDLEKAKALLAEAGYPDGFRTEIYAYRNRDYLEPMLGFLKEIGIETDLRYGKYAATRDAIRSDKVPFAFMTWGSGSVPDADAIVPVFFGDSPDDLARDPEVQAELKKAGSTVDTKVRLAAYKKALSKIADEAYWLPLWTFSTNYAMSQDVDWTPTADEIPRFFFAKWK
ncbi:MAG: ABC transporter substrate-binding protein [Thalassobaculaceae bacterium]|nr:ABC transporter substrate-binding protein [Thalassobaculaceae bacterium]